MAIEVRVADQSVEREASGDLSGTVVVIFDDAVEVMRIQTRFPDRGNAEITRAEAIRAAQQLAQRFVNYRSGLFE
jgi:hypothetical protein